MPSPRPVWAIDIGQCALKALRVRQVGDKIEALAHEYIEHAKILSQPDADRAALIADALKQLLDRHDLRNDRLVVAVPGQSTLSRFVKLPPVKPKDVPNMVRYEASQQIPFDMDEVVWDWQTFRTGETQDLELGIFAMRRELVAEHLAPFTRAGLAPVAVQSAPLALYNALLYDGQLATDATLILDIGAQNTDLLVAEPNALWTRNIPIGGNNFTDALLRTFKISFPKAEQLKRTAATSKYARQIFQAMRPVFADLVSEIQRSLGFYGSTHRNTKIVRAIGMGNAFKLPGLQKFLQQNLSLEMVRPTTFAKLSVASAPNAPQLIEHLLSFGVAYGLALQGLGLTQITSNLLPQEIAKAVLWRRKTPWFWGAAASLALSAGLVWSRGCMDARTLAQVQGNYTGKRQMDRAECERLLQSTQPPGEGRPPAEFAGEVLSLAESLKQAYKELEDKTAEEQNKITAIVAVQKDKALWPRIAQEINNALPKPQPELAKAMAEGAEAFKRAIAAAGDKLARSERQIVTIRSMSVRYGKNVAEMYRQQRAVQPAAGPAGAPPAEGESPAAAAAPGFLIRIEGTTPYKGGSKFLEDTFLRNLASLKKGVVPGFHMVVDLHSGYWCDRLSNREAAGGTAAPSPTFSPGYSPLGPGRGVRRPEFGGRGPEFGGSYGGPRGGGVIGGDFGAGPRVVDTSQNKDPVTGESTANDFVFEVTFQVVLDAPASPEAAQAAPGEGS